MSPAENRLLVNGINGSTGRPLVPPLSLENIVALAMGEKWDLGHLAELKEFKERIEEDSMGLAFDKSPMHLRESGWGTIFPCNVSKEIKRALAPLLEHRRASAAAIHEEYYRELTYLPGETKPEFLARHEVGPGPVDPKHLPYYLLIVGDPEEIPYHFQYQLDVQYAVGRIHFNSVEGYAYYAQGVVAAEQGAAHRPRRLAFFGVSNPDDRPTRRSLLNLVQPLARHFTAADDTDGVHPSDGEPWDVEVIAEEEATKTNLAALLGGDSTPALLFTASHGVGFDAEDPRLLTHQGALLCQDWPGPKRWRDAIPDDHYFAGDDVISKADLAGLISFHFACYSAGTPKYDAYAHRESTRRQLAPKDFVSCLPQRLLAHPEGGALAVVGHIDRAWSYSFDWKEAPQQVGVFASAMESLLDGYPLGAAMEYFNIRYAELSSDLSIQIERAHYGWKGDLMTLSGMWTANNDARAYVVLGDPAVRISPGETAESDRVTTRK